MRPWEKYSAEYALQFGSAADYFAWARWMEDRNPPEAVDDDFWAWWDDSTISTCGTLYSLMCDLADGSPDDPTYATVQHACWIRGCPNFGHWIDDKCPQCGCAPGDAEEVLVQTAPVQ